MIQILRHLVFLLFLALPGMANAFCEPRPGFRALPVEGELSVQRQMAGDLFPRGNFWQATRDGKTLNIIGTMHVFDPQLLPVLDRALPLLETADIAFFELDGAATKAMEQMVVSDPDLFFVRSGPTLPDQLSEADWARLRDAYTARGIPAFYGSQFQPWYATMVLQIPPCAMKDMIAGLRGLDFMLIEEAEKRGIPTASLDDAETIFSIFKSDDPDQVLDALRAALGQEKDSAALMAAMVELYVAGEHRKIWEVGVWIARQELPEDAIREMKTLMLDQRNKAWIDKIMAALPDHDTMLIAVGAAHLSGDTGLLMQLFEQGFELSPITPAN